MENIVLQGRGAFPGAARGTAIVCPRGISGNSGGVGDKDGIIYEPGNPHAGMCIKDCVLVIPGGKGSNGFSAHFKSAKLAGFAPAAWVVLHMDSRVGGAVASTQTPCVCDFTDANPLDLIETGDYLWVDGERGRVEILKGCQSDKEP
ncbi:MAG: DUF126 domain-containing protein [Clostridium sp.]|nr:DUF126 domain-containing protein [Clostridium sp.]